MKKEKEMRLQKNGNEIMHIFSTSLTLVSRIQLTY